MEKRIIIIGAGPTGLGAAYRLKQLGYRNFAVYDRLPHIGGLASSFKDNAGFTWDIGPTILLIRDVVEGVFRDAGRDPADYLDLVQCDPNYRIQFADGSDVRFTTNLARMRDELERIEPGAFERYLAFLAFGRNNYDTSVGQLVSRPLDGLASYLSPSLLRAVFSVRAFRRRSIDSCGQE